MERLYDLAARFWDTKAARSKGNSIPDSPMSDYGIGSFYQGPKDPLSENLKHISRQGTGKARYASPSRKALEKRYGQDLEILLDYPNPLRVQASLGTGNGRRTPSDFAQIAHSAVDILRYMGKRAIAPFREKTYNDVYSQVSSQVRRVKENLDIGYETAMAPLPFPAEKSQS